jgi:tyrosine-protein phosphatase SIW14
MRIFVLSGVLFVSCGTTSVKSEPTTKLAQPAQVITNFQTVEKDVYRGGRITATDILSLSKEQKIKTILSLETYWNASKAKKDEIDTAKKLNIKHINIPMNPAGDLNIKQMWEAVDLLAKQPRPLYVHCYRGSERTGIVVAGYRIKYEKWSYKQATDEMDKYGFNPLFNEWKKALKK